MMHKLLGPHRHALPIQAVERTRAALQVMQDIGVLTQRDILSADKTMVKHAIPAITSDLRHIEILHSRTSFQSQLPGCSTHLVPALIDNLYSILSFVTFLTTSKIAQFEQ
ncbi:hypothetical protein LLG95_14805 [bacterium]|nr:hypothetical protein [bacterium]